MKIGKRVKQLIVLAVCAVFFIGAVSFAACGKTDEPAPGETVLERIEVTRKPTKTEYTEGESFSRSGMVVTAYYSDGTSSPVLGYSVDKTGALSVGDTTVTITYREKTATVAITVKPREIVSQLEITSADPYTYKVEAEDCSLASEELGEPKDTYIERHSATQNNPNTSGGASLGNLNFSNNRITLTIKSEVEASIDIDMILSYNPSLDFDANISTEWNGEQLTTGIIVAKSEGAQYEWFDWHEYTLEDLTLEKGVNTLVFTILNYSVNFDYFKIDVSPVRAEMTGIEITTMPDKTVYSEGENFDPTGMVVTAVYDNGERQTTNDWTADKTQLAYGDTQVTISVGEFTAEVPVTVNPRTATLDKIEITAAPLKTTYKAGEYFLDAGMSVLATYSDGTTENVTDFTTDADPLGVDDTQVTVSYGGKTATVDVTVTEPATAAHIEIADASHAKYSVEAENAFIYKNKDSDTWTVENAANPETGGGKSVGGLNFQTTGIQAVIDSETEATADVVLWLAYNPSLNFDDKTATYWNGERLETGFVVAKAEGAAYEWFDWHPYTIKGVTLKAGVNMLDFVGLGDVSANYDRIEVIVDPVRSLTISSQPDKTEYVSGEAFDPAGMTVTATYASGTSEEVDGYEISPSGPLSAGTEKITVSYEGATAEVPVTVTALSSVTRIEITSQPTKTEYYGGEEFDPTGMVVKAYLSDGSETEVVDYTTDKTTLLPGDTKVTVSYGGQTAEVAVTVKTHMTVSATGTQRIEWEDMLFIKGGGDKETYAIKEDEAASGGKYVESCDWLQGSTFTVTIFSEIEGSVDITMTAANPDFSFDSGAVITWNGEELVTGIHITNGWVIPAEVTSEALTGLPLAEGLNTFVFELTGSASANYDYISFDFAENA